MLGKIRNDTENVTEKNYTYFQQESTSVQATVQDGCYWLLAMDK
jgi:hypothetical protein